MRGYLVKYKTKYTEVREDFVPEELYIYFLDVITRDNHEGQVYESRLTEREHCSENIPVLTEDSFGFVVDYLAGSELKSIFVPTTCINNVLPKLDNAFVRYWTNRMIFVIPYPVRNW